MLEGLTPEEIANRCEGCAVDLYNKAVKQLKCKDLVVILQVSGGKLTNGVVYERTKFVEANNPKESLEVLNSSAAEMVGATWGQTFWLLIALPERTIITTVVVPDIVYKPVWFLN